MDYDRLIKNIEKYSKEKGVSKTKALIDSGVGKDFIINIVKKGTAPSINKLEKLANYYNVSVDVLLGNSEQKEKPAETLSELDKIILEKFRQLSPDKLKIALAQLDALVALELDNPKK